MTQHAHAERVDGCYRCELNDDELGNDGLTDAERSELAERYETTTGATPPPSPERTARLKAAADEERVDYEIQRARQIRFYIGETGPEPRDDLGGGRIVRPADLLAAASDDDPAPTS